MAIVLNEYEWAERMITERKLGKKPGETLARVAKYYFERGYSKREVRKLLDEFLMQCDPDASLVGWSATLDKITKTASRYSPIQIDYLPIYSGELEWIMKLNGKQLRRLAFTLLCVSKYWNAISENNNHWVNTQDREIFQMANVAATSKKQDLMYGELIREGYIRQSRRIDSLNVQMLPPDTDGEVAMLIKDFRNLGYQYMKHYGESYFECEKCGITVREREYTPNKSVRRGCRAKETGRKHKYCPECAAEIRLKQNIDSVMRRRHSVLQ